MSGKAIDYATTPVSFYKLVCNNPEIKSIISKKARDALFNCKVQPWNATVDIRDYQVGGGENPFYSPEVPKFRFSVEKPWISAGTGAGAGAGNARTRRRKQMRKRTRKNLRSR